MVWELGRNVKGSRFNDKGNPKVQCPKSKRTLAVSNLDIGIWILDIPLTLKLGPWTFPSSPPRDRRSLGVEVAELFEKGFGVVVQAGTGFGSLLGESPGGTLVL